MLHVVGTEVIQYTSKGKNSSNSKVKVQSGQLLPIEATFALTAVSDDRDILVFLEFLISLFCDV